MDREELFAHLDYTIGSPPEDRGGFNPQTVEMAKAAKNRILGLEDLLQQIDASLKGNHLWPVASATLSESKGDK